MDVNALVMMGMETARWFIALLVLASIYGYGITTQVGSLHDILVRILQGRALIDFEVCFRQQF